MSNKARSELIHEYCQKLPEQLIRKPLADSILKIDHEQCSFNPLRYTDRYGKVCMCPYSKVIRKHCFATGKIESLIVPCGRCMYCNHKRQNQLIYRIFNHRMYNNHCLFVTLTYNPLHYPVETELCKSDAQKFYKRLRKKFDWKTFSYFHTCERGKRTGRLHHHFILFWKDDSISVQMVKEAVNDSWRFPARCFPSSEDASQSAMIFRINELDSHNSVDCYTSAGFTYFGEVNKQSVTYVTKYMNKNNRKLTIFQTWSKGLGKDILSCPDFVDKARYLNLMSYVPDPVKQKRYYVVLPRYYKDKVFSQAERDKMFIGYLSSDDHFYKLNAVKDPDFVLNQIDLFKSYRSSCDAVERAHDVDRQLRLHDL